MSAAIEASEGGRVILLEGQAALGGSARYGAAITAIDGGQGLGADFSQRVRTDVLDWTRRMGVKWLPARDPSGLRAQLMQPEGGGRTLVASLAAQVRASGVDVRLSARVVQVHRQERWQVTLADGSVQEGDALVVATGGFLGALSRARSALQLPDLVRSSPVFLDGAGEDWLAAHGAVTPDVRRAVVYGHAVRHPGDPERALMVVDALGAVVVDAAGNVLSGLLVPRGGIEPSDEERFLVVRGSDLERIQFFDPLDEMVHDARTVFAKGGWIAADGSMGAIALVQTGAKSLTGVAVDADGQVLDAGSKPISGLFAAGEVAGFGPGGHPPVDNTMVAAAILGGRAAGRAAARAR